MIKFRSVEVLAERTGSKKQSSEKRLRWMGLGEGEGPAVWNRQCVEAESERKTGMTHYGYYVIVD